MHTWPTSISDIAFYKKNMFFKLIETPECSSAILDSDTTQNLVSTTQMSRDQE